MRRRNRAIVLMMAIVFLVMISVPVQPVVAYSGSTHTELDKRAISNLLAMFPNGAAEIDNYRSRIDEGNLWADKQPDNPDRPFHYHDASTHLGVFGIGTSAAYLANVGMNRAKNEYDAGNLAKAYFWVGFALHHVQDLTTPCHADIGTLGSFWHIPYEDYCWNHHSILNGVTDAIFTFNSYWLLLTHCNPNKASGWVDYAAHTSEGYQFALKMSHFKEVAEVLMPFALRLTAGFLVFAYHYLNPSSDVDSDGLPFATEEKLGSFDWDVDSDDDNVDDFYEATHFMDLMNPDSDSDGMPDGWEVNHNLMPANAIDAGWDHDSDGLTNLQEYQKHTNPRNADTDGDTMPDGWEVTYNLNPCIPGDKHSDPDGDGLSNYKEYQNSANPRDADTDDDSLSDYAEVYTWGTKPYRWDTDGDGWSDGYEVAHGYNPLDPNSHPKPIRPPRDPFPLP